MSLQSVESVKSGALDPNTVTRLREAGKRARNAYDEALTRNLQLDMTRGKPCPEQLDLSLGLLDCVTARDYRAADGTDCRNYGGLDGLPEARELFARYLGVSPREVLIGGNSSLTLFHDCLVQAKLRGVPGSREPWARHEKIRVLCPAPGYDRHFLICEHLGFEMIPIAMTPSGPDMDEVERRASEDDAVKAIVCVPRYSNPTGVTYSHEVVERLASMQTKAPDFRILWDDAYAVHHLTETPPKLRNGLEAAKAAGHPDRVLLFASTSKISFAGAGLAAVAGSETNVGHIRENRALQTIGPDKLNQLRHVRFFRDLGGIERHMKRHAAILAPKFQAVHEILEQELGGLSVAQWSRPQGGYFINLDTLDGCAKRVVELARGAGVKLTPAGATFPYGKDPRDRNLRLAPTLPSLPELKEATKLLAACIVLASLER